MKKIITSILLLIVVFTVPALTFAAEKEAAPAKKSPARHAAGDVASVDARANTITLKVPKKPDVTVAVDEKTKVLPKGKVFGDIKVGDKIKAVYTETGGKNIAGSITIMPVPKKAEKKETATTTAPAKKEAVPAEKKEPAPAAEKKETAPAKKEAAPAKKPAGGY